MRNPLFLLPLLLAACGAQDGIGSNGAGSVGAAPPGAPAAPGETPAAPERTVQTATLVGLYEGGPAAERSQMCVLDRAGESRFGLVVRRPGGEGCSGAGSAVRAGNALRLAMAGDEPCTIEARIEGVRVAFPAALPPGCAYYCSRGGSFAGATLDKTGGGEADAMRAQDMVGDRLCAR